MSLISVIIPCHKYAHFLSECTESVLTQAGVDLRVLIIDDASPDNTAEVATELAARDSRIEFVKHAMNQGHIATYNEGLEWASGDYTLLLSADDLLVPGALLRAAQLMDAHSDVGFVYGPALAFLTSQPLPTSRAAPPTYRSRVWAGRDWLEAGCRAGHIYIRSPEVVVRTRLQHELGGYRTELPHTADIEMWMRFAAHAAVGEILDADQAFYRVHTQNMHHQQPSGSLDDLLERRGAFDILFQAYGDRVKDSTHLRNLAHRRIAREALGTACYLLDQRRVAEGTIAELVNFALDTYPRLPSVLEYWGLQCRLRLGRLCHPLLRFARETITDKRPGPRMGRES